ncbi:MAG: hypothetical protein LBK03_02995 [Bacteroidales bacterium]|jgi:hypothetical protein|nr:hypothetical protein [Bacteroidales bacterium]
MATNIFKEGGERKIALKEAVRKKIANAISEDRYKIANIALPKESWLEKSPNLQNEFIILFRSLGGKYIPCTRENFLYNLKQIIQNRRYATVLNTSKLLTESLKKYDIRHTNIKPYGSNADVAIVYAEALIGISGSIFSSSQHSYYASVKNLAKDLIVISFAENIVATLSEALTLQQQNGGNKGCIYEVLTPTLLPSPNKYSAKEPRIILMLIK